MPTHTVNRPKRAIFAGLVRDCAEWLPSVLANVEQMAHAFEQCAFLFLENGSTDGSRELLNRWCSGRDGAIVLTPDDPAAFCVVRTVRLAVIRNQIIAEARRHYADFDVLVLLDCDNVNASPISQAAFIRALDFLWHEPDRAAVFANSLGHYYDLWALRHALYCPLDVWEETMDYSISRRVSPEAAFKAVFAPRTFALPLDAPPLEVDSAFGGMGIYRLSCVLANKASYDGYKLRDVETAFGRKRMGWQTCEHVSFNIGLRKDGGRLFVLPWLSIYEFREVTVVMNWEFALFDPLELAMFSDPALVPAPQNAVIGRNERCFCGSGERYKHCHGAMATS